MPRRLSQSAAYTVVFKVFLSSDHVTPATSKTVAITLSKAGAAFANPSAGASNATEIANGWYKFALSAADTDTLGDLVLVGTATACDSADIIMQVGVDGVARGVVGSIASTTSVPTSAFQPAGASADQFAGRAILFDANTATAALRGCARTIANSTNAANPTLTVGALPTAPASGDTFSVI